MRFAAALLSLAFASGALSLAPDACAADAAELRASLSAAEQAYQEVDFERAYALGREALERGQASRSESARLYVLLGMSSAALEHDDEARRYFSVALAIDPGHKLEKNLSPKIRGPYLEAAAALALYQTALALSVSQNLTARRLTLRLEDPLSLVKKLEVRLRALGDETYRSVELPPRSESAVPLNDELFERGFEYDARALDEFGNALFELGSATDPVSVAAEPSRRIETPLRLAEAAVSRRTTPWLAIGLGTTGLLGVGAGAYFQVRREQSAREWNGPRCEQPGATRGAQCGDVDSERRRFQTAAIISYAAGGALLVSGAVAWALHRPYREQASVACGAFGTTVACSGRF